jgi:hypothetical protein
MTDLPRHPDAHDVGAPEGRGSSPKGRRWSYLLVIVVATLLVAMVVLHFAGVFGPGSH